MISVVIRDYSVKDSIEIIEIDREAFNTLSPSYDLYIYLTYGKDIIVAELNSKVVGYLVLMDLGREEKIMSIAVKKEYRRKGIGEMLLREAIRRVKSRGKERIILEVRVSNTPAINLYKKMGFYIIGRLNSYYSDGEDAFLMALDLRDRI